MPQPTILVGFAEALAAPEVVWSLVDEGFRVAAFARRGRASALRYSRHVVCHEICPPESDLAASLSDMSSLLASLAPEPGSQGILFPLDDKAVWLCNRLQHRGNWILAGPQGTSADLALNKYLQIEAARRAGFDVPHAALAQTAKDVFDFSATEPFPLILKPADCVPILRNRANSFRKWICANRAELEGAVNEWAGRVSLLVQRFVTGTGTGIFGLAAPDGIRAWSAHRRLRMMNPQGSGSSACISQTLPPDLRRKAETLIAGAGWRGLFMIELLQDASGNSWFVELNGRPWGSMALSRRQGLEYPAWHVRLTIDGRDPVGMTLPARRDVVCRHIGRELMHLLFVLRGARSKALSNWPSFWKTVGQMMCLHRSDALYNWRRDDPKVFLADCYYTIHDNLFKARN
jgi:hypothetical protein